MAYGLGDALMEADEESRQALRLLVKVAKGKKSVRYVQKWLEKHHPHLLPKKNSRKTKKPKR